MSFTFCEESSTKNSQFSKLLFKLTLTVGRELIRDGPFVNLKNTFYEPVGPISLASKRVPSLPPNQFVDRTVKVK